MVRRTRAQVTVHLQLLQQAWVTQLIIVDVVDKTTSTEAHAPQPFLQVADLGKEESLHIKHLKGLTDRSGISGIFKATDEGEKSWLIFKNQTYLQPLQNVSTAQHHLTYLLWRILE